MGKSLSIAGPVKWTLTSLLIKEQQGDELMSLKYQVLDEDAGFCLTCEFIELIIQGSQEERKKYIYELLLE